jgi:hypothetical protein
MLTTIVEYFLDKNLHAFVLEDRKEKEKKSTGYL